MLPLGYIETDLLLVDPGGSVGIGTASPASQLHIRDAGPVGLTLEADTDNSNEEDNPSVVLTQDGGNVVGRMGYRLGENDLELVNEYSEDLVLGTNNTDVVTLTAGGKVGVGTSAPDDTLSVVGNIGSNSPTADTAGRLHTYGPNGNINVRATFLSTSKPDFGFLAVRDDNNVDRAKMYVDDTTGDPLGYMETDVLIINGADIAEPFDVNHEPVDAPSVAASEPGTDSAVQPGMVVSIDPAHAGALRVCTSRYDRMVAGVISGAGGVRPGVMLRQKGTAADGAHPVALTGRVYCYVDTEAGGAIRPGDLLTTSETPGHAMKVSNHDRAQGAILGKAMTSLERGRGLVLVLVTLQ